MLSPMHETGPSPTILDQLNFPTFHPQRPWRGGDLQTIRAELIPPHDELAHYEQKQLVLPLNDGSGDALAATLNWSASPPPSTPLQAPAIVLIHGLGGSAESSYMVASATHLLECGYRVFRLNLRGAGASQNHCRLVYNPGRTDDLRDAVVALSDIDGLAHGVVLVGFSLGGNILLKFMAEDAGQYPVRGAATVSAPLDLAATSKRLGQRRNSLYQWVLLQRMKRECLRQGARLSEEERNTIKAARSVWEFDDRFSAPRNNYSGAEPYYTDNSATRSLSRISLPTLLIYAFDDPIVPADTYRNYRWAENPHLIPLLVEKGGHTGFHGRNETATWHDRCIAKFVAALDSVPLFL